MIGYDGTETVQSVLPDLTTIQQPIELISKTAIEILAKEIEGEFDDLPLETCLLKYGFWKDGQRSQTVQPYVPTELRSILSAPAISFSQGSGADHPHFHFAV